MTDNGPSQEGLISIILDSAEPIMANLPLSDRIFEGQPSKRLEAGVNTERTPCSQILS